LILILFVFAQWTFAAAACTVPHISDRLASREWRLHRNGAVACVAQIGVFLSQEATRFGKPQEIRAPLTTHGIDDGRPLRRLSSMENVFERTDGRHRPCYDRSARADTESGALS
jgi:hypothetical protein